MRPAGNVSFHLQGVSCDLLTATSIHVDCVTVDTAIPYLT